MKGLRGLVKEVLSSGICVACGACAGVCPHLVFRDGRLICLDDCSREEGHCYDVLSEDVIGGAHRGTDRRSHRRISGQVPQGTVESHRPIRGDGFRPCGVRR